MGRCAGRFAGYPPPERCQRAHRRAGRHRRRALARSRPDHVNLLVFDGVSVELLAEQPALHSNANGFHDLMLGLHEGLFAGPLLRALYVLSGLLGAAMITTGLVLWAVKRRQRIEKAREAPHLGLRLVEKLNVATIIGLPVAIAAYFWANRLLPLELVNRAD
ncbi:PepSY-associated TM helix domain-containing protein [Thioalkalicoccus limnaeus]|uniref:PepSY-associated TM helix domain-containing protein n=1 Tax=Thioalkalicoccus limnaeus TaxID=120681 RepID=A0ABV4BKW7_9GAMM